MKYNDFCCDRMKFAICEHKKLIEYMPESRSYNFILGKNDKGTHWGFEFCPWCGTKLPSNLSDKWAETLKQEYNIIEPFWEDKQRVPPEFWIDEWWKKRGL